MWFSWASITYSFIVFPFFLPISDSEASVIYEKRWWWGKFKDEHLVRDHLLNLCLFSTSLSKVRKLWEHINDTHRGDPSLKQDLIWGLEWCHQDPCLCLSALLPSLMAPASPGFQFTPSQLQSWNREGTAHCQLVQQFQDSLWYEVFAWLGSYAHL